MKELSIPYLLQLAWRRIIVLLAALLAFSIAAFCYCRFIATERYLAKTSLMVTNGGILFGTTKTDDESSSVYRGNNEFALSINMMDTYANYLRTDEIYDELSEDWMKYYPNRQQYTAGAIKGMATVSRREDKTFFLDLSISATNKQDAVDIARLFSKVAIKNIQESFPDTVLKAVNVLDSEAVASKTAPKTRSITMSAGFVGLVLAYVAVVLIDLTDHAIAGEEGYTARFDVPLLGSVPYFESNVSFGSHYSNKGGYYYSEYGKNESKK